MFLGILSLGILLTLTYFFLVQLHHEFFYCPNKEFLLWDANIRFIQAIDFLQLIKKESILDGLKLLIDSPTWPPLRTILSILSITWYGKPNPIVDIYWNVFFFVLSIITLTSGTFFFFRKELQKDVYHAVLINLSIFLSISFLFLLKQIPEYIFSSMLEIQGIFAYSGFLFFYLALYRSNYQVWLKNLYFRIFFFLSGFLVYFTKYPYGVLVILSFLFVEFLLAPKNIIQELKKILSYYRGYRFVFLILPFFSVILILINPYIRFEIISHKFLKNFMFFSLLLFLIEFHIFLFRKKVRFFSERIRFFYKFFLFPFLVVVFTHPDRFHSLLGAQSDTIDRSRSFFISLFYDYFLNSSGFSLMIFLSIVLLFVFIFRAQRSIENFSIIFEKKPVLVGIVFLWFHLAILELLTTNHQARYIFQILPGMILLHGLSFLITPKRWKVFVIIILSAILLQNLHLFYQENFVNKREVCFAGKQTEIFEPAKKIYQFVPEDIQGLIFNEFHLYRKFGIELENPYLFIPTDIDVWIRYKVYDKGFVLNYNHHQKILNQQKDWIYITHDCQNNLFESPFWNLSKRIKIHSYELVDIQKINQQICYKRYVVDFDVK